MIALDTLTKRAKHRLQESASRLDRAARLVHWVRSLSQADGDLGYTVEGTVCGCRDYEFAPAHRCKHVLAVMLATRLCQVGIALPRAA